MNDEFVSRVAAGLGERGVRGARAARVLAEVRDHLAEAERHGDANPAASFGDPVRFSRDVAAELATSQTRRATYASFAALAFVGLGYVLALGLVPAAGGWQDSTDGRLGVLGPVLAITLVLLPQIAFVAGCLALLAALRLRLTRVVAGAQLQLLRRRSAVALGAGAVTMLALAAFALDASGELASWWTWTTLALSASAVVPLAVATHEVAEARHPLAESEGRADDVFDDLGPVLDWAPIRRLELPEHPWRFALTCAVGVFALGLAGGWYAEGGPGSGLVRGTFEAAALLICFAALGRVLGLRRTSG